MDKLTKYSSLFGIRFNRWFLLSILRASKQESENEKNIEKLRQAYREKCGEEPIF